GPAGQLVLFAKLYDVAPDGSVTLPERIVSPVRVADVTRVVHIALPGIVKRWPAGHRIRLVLAASDGAYAGNTAVLPVTVHADPVADQCEQLLAQAVRGDLRAGLEHPERARHLTLERVVDPDHRALGDGRVAGDHLFDRAGGQAVPGHVDDVVDPAHHEQVPVLVAVAAVAGGVPAGVAGEVRLDVPLVVAPQGGQASGWQRQFDHEL